MEQAAAINLLKKNFSRIEEKFDLFFKEREPRWPGENRDFLRNHHKNLDNLSMRNITFDRLGIYDLPENIVKELELAFEAFREGIAYQ
ncbi:MAG: hypothetical protein ACHQET_06010 [Chitinophagales bacterium]